MKYLLLTVFFTFFIFSIQAQEDGRPKDGPAFYFNSFQNYKDKNVDSSLYFANKLAANPPYIGPLQDLLHKVFAQTFIKGGEKDITDSAKKIEYKQQVEIGKTILNRMVSDTNKNLAKTARPVFLWVQAQENENDNKELVDITTEFIRTELSINDIHQNSIGRYALLIYKIISPKNELTKLSDELFANIAGKLKANQVNVNVDTASRLLLDKRAWYRYLFAYCNFIQATKFSEQKNNKEAGKYFKLAYNYSPDLTDKNNYSSYFYDMMFLFEKEKNSFQEDYLSYLINNNSDKKQTLTTLLTVALANPSYKEQLRSFYTTNFSNKEDFSTYWIKAINNNLKAAPSFSLQQLDGNSFATVAHKGKWMLIDFWGTWCGPCRKEHPDLQKFYQNIATNHADKISLLTIACRDKEDKVLSYIAKNKYTFPVAMSDNKIENIYPVKGYPTKILITPQGRYLTVPFGIDWVEFVKEYCDL